MRYNLTIQKCDADAAFGMAPEIAAMIGSTVSDLAELLQQRNVIIRGFDTVDAALELKSRLAMMGAVVDLAPQELPVSPQSAVTDDDEEEGPHRVLSNQEYTDRVKSRDDIFYIERNRFLAKLETVCLIVAVAVGTVMSSMELITVDSDFIDNDDGDRRGALIREPIEPPKAARLIERPPTASTTDRKILKNNSKRYSGHDGSGGGNPFSRIVKKGILALTSGKMTGRTIALADIFAKGGSADGIDALLSGPLGLATGGNGGTGRKGESAIGFGPGYGSGSGGNGGGDNLVDDLMAGAADNVKLEQRYGTIELTPIHLLQGSHVIGGRNKATIQRVIRQNMSALRYAYNKFLNEHPAMQGKVTIRFAIDEFGRVIFCDIINSSTGSSEFDLMIAAKIKRWAFDRIDKPGDVTEVVFPFVFTT
jgi:TonB family protein